MNTALPARIKNMSPLLLVADIEKSIKFYTQELGFKLSFRYDDFYSGIFKDGCSIHLKLSGKPAIEEKQKRKSNDDVDTIFSVEGIENMYGNISNKSVDIIQPLREMAYEKEFYIADPDGYIIAFVEEI